MPPTAAALIGGAGIGGAGVGGAGVGLGVGGVGAGVGNPVGEKSLEHVSLHFAVVMNPLGAHTQILDMSNSSWHL